MREQWCPGRAKRMALCPSGKPLLSATSARLRSQVTLACSARIGTDSPSPSRQVAGRCPLAWVRPSLRARPSLCSKASQIAKPATRSPDLRGLPPLRMRGSSSPGVGSPGRELAMDFPPTCRALCWPRGLRAPVSAGEKCRKNAQHPATEVTAQHGAPPTRINQWL